MPAGRERDDLNRDPGRLDHLDQVRELITHDVLATDRAAQHGLVHHHPVFGGFGAPEQFLAREPQRHPAFGFLFGGGGEAGGGDGPDVALGLQQPGDDLRFVGADQAGRFLQADRDAEPGRQDVVVAVPPSRFAGVAGQGQESVDLADVGDAVGHQQALDGQRLETAFGSLHPADRPGRGIDGLGGLLVAHPGFFPQCLQLPGQDHAQHGGTTAWRRLSHPLPPAAVPGVSLPRPSWQCNAYLVPRPLPSVPVRSLPLPFCSLHGSR